MRLFFIVSSAYVGTLGWKVQKREDIERMVNESVVSRNQQETESKHIRETYKFHRRLWMIEVSVHYTFNTKNDLV